MPRPHRFVCRSVRSTTFASEPDLTLNKKGISRPFLWAPRWLEGPAGAYGALFATKQTSVAIVMAIPMTILTTDAVEGLLSMAIFMLSP